MSEMPIPEGWTEEDLERLLELYSETVAKLIGSVYSIEGTDYQIKSAVCWRDEITIAERLAIRISVTLTVSHLGTVHSLAALLRPVKEEYYFTNVNSENLTKQFEGAIKHQLHLDKKMQDKDEKKDMN